MKKYIMCFSLLCLSLVAFSQKTITGVVYDETGKEPLPGTSVVIQGTSNGTVTDINGNYSIDGVLEKDILEYRFVGYDIVKELVGKRTVIDVVFDNSSLLLNDLVVVGYGTTKRSDLTGSVASIASEDLVKAATSNFDQALAGRVAGLNIGSTDGTPGESLNIVIRGGNSITGDNSPLYVVDGMPLEDFDPATLITDDIENFEVLKDASATAIYGSRGANGVIIITTKKGRTDGKTDVKASLSYRLDYIPSRLEVLSPYEFAKYQESVAYAQDGYYPGQYVKYYESSFADASYYKDAEGIDWQDKIFQTAPTYNGKLSINGGNKTTNFYYSGEYLNQTGTMINTGFVKLINNLKVSHRINSKAKINVNLQYSYLNRKGMTVRGNAYNSVIRDAIRFRSVEPIYEDDLEEGGYDPLNPNHKYFFNPVKNLENTDKENRSNVTRGGLDFYYNFSKNLTLRMNGNYQIDNRKEYTFSGEDTYYGSRGSDRINAQMKFRNYSTLSSSNTLTYKKTIKGHKVSGMVGIEAQQRGYEYAYLKNSQLPTDLLGIGNIGLGTSPGVPQTYLSGNSLLSYFGRATYALRDKYLATVTVRADGSSKFKNDPWGYFPSFSTGWRLSEERFLMGLDVLSNAKVRAGWGLTGNNRIGDFDSYSQLNVSNSSGYVWGNGETYMPGVYQDNMGVPDLRWEKTAQGNIGLDLGFFAQRVTVNLDLYNKNTTDLLLNAEMAQHTGFSKVQQNIGEVNNRGVEIVLNTVNVNKPNFKWSTNFNISFNKNEVKALNAGQNEILTDPEWGSGISEYQYVTRIGQPVGMMYGLEYDGLYQMSDFTYDNETGVYSLIDGIADNGNAVLAPGSVKLVDQNGDGTVNSSDRVIIGNPHPKHFGGLTNSFEFLNGFDCQILLQWSYGADVLNGNKVSFATPSNNFNGLEELSRMWTPYNTDTDVNTLVYNSVYGSAPKGNNVDSRAIEDGSFLRVKSIALGYTLPSAVSQRMKMSRTRISISANNLYTWTNYSGYDPDVSVGRYGALTPALDYSAYPNSTSVMATLDITF